MLDVKNLTVKRGGKLVLSDVAFALEPKTITAVAGKNGSGKSTLCECINRMVAYDGIIILDGTDIAEIPEGVRARRISYLPQIQKTPHITVAELVEIGRTPYKGIFGCMSEEDRKACDSAIRAVEVENIRSCFVDELSGGERQKAYLAMMLAQDTEIMILDEPTANMDISFRRSFCNMLTRLCRNGKTILVVMHDIACAIETASHIVLLDSGKLSFYGTTEKCLECGAIESVFNVRRIEAEGKSFFVAE